MFCISCGKYNPDNATSCKYCGGSLTNRAPVSQQSQYRSQYKSYGESKTVVGVLLGLFLGLIGLIIGVCLYPSGSEERSTFIKGWIIAFVIGAIVSLIILIGYGSMLAELLPYMYNMQ